MLSFYVRGCATRSTARGRPYPFDAVYYINLASRPDRRSYIEKDILTRHRFHDLVPLVQRLEGIDGGTVDLLQLHREGKITDRAKERFYTVPLHEKLYGMDLTPGALGCAFSHREIWRRIVQRKHRAALVLEDDVELSPKFPSAIYQRMQDVPSDWELLYLGGVDLLSTDKPQRPLIAPGWRRAYAGQRELTAYVLHERSARRCLELTECLDWQIDTHLCMKTTPDFKYSPNLPSAASRRGMHTVKGFRPDTHPAEDKYISDPMSYAMQPTLAIQLSRFGSNVQKTSELETGDAHGVDATRRIREFFMGLTSLR